MVFGQARGKTRSPRWAKARRVVATHLTSRVLVHALQRLGNGLDAARLAFAHHGDSRPMRAAGVMTRGGDRKQHKRLLARTAAVSQASRQQSGPVSPDLVRSTAPDRARLIGVLGLKPRSVEIVALRSRAWGLWGNHGRRGRVGWTANDACGTETASRHRKVESSGRGTWDGKAHFEAHFEESSNWRWMDGFSVQKSVFRFAQEVVASPHVHRT